MCLSLNKKPGRQVSAEPSFLADCLAWPQYAANHHVLDCRHMNLYGEHDFRQRRTDRRGEIGLAFMRR
jgi:hypothetical protein